MRFSSVLLPALTALVALVFVAAVLQRWRSNRRPYLLLWAIGIAAFGLGAAAEAAFGLWGWNPLLFRLYYLSGAILAAAWLGQGTVQLLGRAPWTRVSLVVLTLLSLYGVYEVSRAKLEPAFMARRIGDVVALEGAAPEALLESAGQAVATPRGALMDAWARAVAQQAGVDYGEVTQAPERIPYGLRKGDVAVGTAAMVESLGIEAPQASGASGTAVYVVEGERVRGYLELLPALEMNGSAIIRSSSNARSITPLFNVYGTLGLAGGAVYSALLFFRKRTLYYRMLGNVLIATGALAPALGGTLSKAGLPYAVQVSNLIGIVVIYAGFVQATRTDVPVPAQHQVKEQPA
ncbi:MAG TPA: hypothetical protein VLA19_17700 [Herpetosiphonaceae bacterium]|nr:hypothetical protein [Herpetosiphonaceae bacterium]